MRARTRPAGTRGRRLERPRTPSIRLAIARGQTPAAVPSSVHVWAIVFGPRRIGGSRVRTSSHANDKRESRGPARTQGHDPAHVNHTKAMYLRESLRTLCLLRAQVERFFSSREADFLRMHIVWAAARRRPRCRAQRE